MQLKEEINFSMVNVEDMRGGGRGGRKGTRQKIRQLEENGVTLMFQDLCSQISLPLNFFTLPLYMLLPYKSNTITHKRERNERVEKGEEIDRECKEVRDMVTNNHSQCLFYLVLVLVLHSVCLSALYSCMHK